jgi:hypothetical protein
MPLRIVLTVISALAGPAAPPDRQLDLMTREADAIWRPHGVRVALHRAGGPPPSPGPGGELALGLRFATASPSRRLRLGAIWLIDGVPQDSIEIGARDVAALLGATPWGGRRLGAWPPEVGDRVTGRALGRVLAHEIGHFLLASPVHAARGLMRAAFAARELARADRRTFELDREHLPRLSARVAQLRPPRVNAAAGQP